MRYEAGPFAGIRFFVSPRGLLVQSGRFLGLQGGLRSGGGGLPGRIIALSGDFSYRREFLAQSG